MRHIVYLLSMVMLGSFFISCSSSEEMEHETVINLVSDPQPVNLTAEQTVFVNDNNGFALNFFKASEELSDGKQSTLYSPLSITYVLGMINDAAEGTTEEELEQTLGFHNGGVKAVNNYCKTLIDNLPKVDDKVTLNIANALFVNKQYSLKKQFQQDMSQYYDALTESLDFSSSQTLNRINNWCREKTNDMIPTILEELNPHALSYLLNAIYFKADWTSKFDTKMTKKEKFTTPSGSQTMPIMHQKVYINYLRNSTFSAVDIPYGNGYWLMTVMLPEEGKTPADVINLLAAQGWSADYSNNPLSGIQTYEVDLKLPRYETSSDTNDLPVSGGLIGVLKKLGISRIFTDMSELPNMCEERTDVYISMMRQKAKIKVNEEGSEAAAVTIAETVNTALPSNDPVIIPKADFHATRPFVYLIREASSGVILFVGKYTGE